MEAKTRKQKRGRPDVEAIAIDEMYLFPHERPGRKYVTIVRDAMTSRVLSVTRGKGFAALRKFA